ncbi:flagellar hook capping protein [Chthonomonas calidirosea]|uniref:FlgD immunoglobulin-like domain containing protein n=1 Tax=Chthonomonas calidirosea TaxID=454171 RepID=UPI0006DD516F|nr:FlgD immunoglobulin-like domain containing protein [Chthonomonas calidirosea]CEK13812.1 flagellar hook capping protein [Chthonomonas calidirosea]
MKSGLRQQAILLPILVLLSLGDSGSPQNSSTPSQTQRFYYTLSQQAITSAGVYDSNGHLIRVLWQMQPTSAGKHTATWNGLDMGDQPAPPGRYHLLVAANFCVYRNVGVIGNSGLPPNAQGHTPASILCVATDQEGNIYTANGWDEAGADFKKWDKYGHSVYDAHFQIRNGKPNGIPYAIAVDKDYLYCTVGGWASPPWNERQQVERFRLSDGQEVPFSGQHLVDGHIQIYEWPSHLLPQNVPPDEAELLKTPLRGIAVDQQNLFVTDLLGNRVWRFDKESGDLLGSFSVPTPRAIAVDPQGHVWVSAEKHEIRVYSATGQQLAVPIHDLSEAVEIAFSPLNKLYVADTGAGQVKIYAIHGLKARRIGALGQKAKAGDRAPDRFFHLTGIAIAPDGSIITTQKEPISGARLAKWSPNGKLQWEQWCTEFVSLGINAPDSPTLFLSMSGHLFHLDDFEHGKSRYVADGLNDPVLYHSDVHGVPRILTFQGRRFLFLPTGDGVQVYRLEGHVLHLAALVGGRDPDATGKSHYWQQPHPSPPQQWTWHDQHGTGHPQMNEILWFKPPGKGTVNVFGMDVDDQGNIWFANLDTHSIWELPKGRLDTHGNPTYDWAKAHEVIPHDVSSLGFDPTMAQRADDGSIYALGWSHTWPSPPNNPFWMGGTTLVRFDKLGRRLWAVPLPEVCPGICFLPGGGCLAGGGRSANIYHYTSNGLLVGKMAPGAAMGNQSGWFDNHACVAVTHNPLDHGWDVFAEDDYVDRIAWYRIEGKIALVNGDSVIVADSLKRPSHETQ